jgi:archaemetzincin
MNNPFLFLESYLFLGETIKIKIIPLGEVSETILEKVREELKFRFRMVGQINPIEKLPESSFNKFRNQYRSDLVLQFLEKQHKDRVIGITKEDLYTQGLNYIFGQAKLKGKTALLSIARLDPVFFHQPVNEDLYEKRILKEAVHEVGHMLGLEHCNKRGCVMNFSNTIGEVDKKTNYLCDMCKMQLGL